MARITLEQQWDEVNSQIDKLKENIIEAFKQTMELPKVVYRLNGYNLEEHEVTGAYVLFRNDKMFVRHPIFYGKKPTGWDLEQLKSFKNDIDNFNITAVIFIRTCIVYSYGKATNSVSFNSLTNPDRTYNDFSIDKEFLLKEAEIRRQKYEPKEGCSPCAYCRVQTPIDKLIEATIIGRGRNRLGKACVTTQVLKFCSKKCASNEQMSREG
jgi:hypothetical protein